MQAYEILKKKQNAQLVLVGKIDEDLKKIIDNKEEIRDTLMPGFVSDQVLAAWYKTADVFVFPSLYEGFGLPGLESMTAGLAVVASNTSSLPEIYSEAALYFDPSNPVDIADKIKVVLSDKKIRQNLIERGKIIAAKYSWKKTASETLKIYNSLGR